MARARVSLTRRSTRYDEGRFAVGERVRGERKRTLKGARASLLRSQGRRSSQRKASWVWVCRGANPTMAKPNPGRVGFQWKRAWSAPFPARSGDRGRQRSGLSGEASSADGRRRSAAAAVAPPQGVSPACCTGRDRPKLSRLKPVLSGAPMVCSANCGSGDREPTRYDECHRGAPRSVEARLG